MFSALVLAVHVLWSVYVLVLLTVIVCCWILDLFLKMSSLSDWDNSTATRDVNDQVRLLQSMSKPGYTS